KIELVGISTNLKPTLSRSSATAVIMPDRIPLAQRLCDPSRKVVSTNSTFMLLLPGCAARPAGRRLQTSSGAYAQSSIDVGQSAPSTAAEGIIRRDRPHCRIAKG